MRRASSPSRNRRPESSSSTTKIIIGLVAVAVFMFVWASLPSGYHAQPLFSSPESLDGVTKDRVMEALIKENRRLSDKCGEDSPGVHSLAAAPTGTSSTAALEARVALLTAENERLKTSLKQAKTALVAANEALSARGTRGGAAAASSSQLVLANEHSLGTDRTLAQVPSCAHQKLEFLRWTKDKAGNKLWCPFTPENYDNWTKMPPFCDYISIECLGEGNLRAAHVFGFGGPGLMIGIADQMMWEFVFARHKNMRHMAELGTMTGGTSLYFGMAARVRGGTFHTFDRSENRPTEIRRGWLDNMFFHMEDILTGRSGDNPNMEVVKVLDIGEPMIALFDNGDKTRETKFYARYLAVGSVLLLHDWEHLDLPRPHWEMTYSFVKEELEGRGFVKAYHDFAEHIGSSTRAFIRKSRGSFK